MTLLMPWAVTMYGPCSLHFLLCHNVIPGSSTIRPAEREGPIVSWDIEVFALFFPAEVIMFLFSRSFFSYQGKLRVVPGQL